MILRLTKKNFSAMVKRFQDTFSFGHCLGEVAHQLDKDGNSTLGIALEHHFEKNPTTRTIDRKRASESLSMAMTGGSYNVLSAQLKKEAVTESVDATAMANLRGYTGLLEDVIFTLSSEGAHQAKKLIDAILFCTKEMSNDVRGNASQLTERETLLGTETEFWAALHDLFLNTTVAHIHTRGFDEHHTNHHGMYAHSRDVILTLSDGTEIEFNMNYKESEAGLDEMDMVFTIDGEDLYDIFDPDGDSHEVDKVLEQIGDLGSEKFTDHANADLVDLNDERNAQLASVVVPEFAKAVL